jgi:hypothetical protein
MLIKLQTKKKNKKTRLFGRPRCRYADTKMCLKDRIRDFGLDFYEIQNDISGS